MRERGAMVKTRPPRAVKFSASAHQMISGVLLMQEYLDDKRCTALGSLPKKVREAWGRLSEKDPGYGIQSVPC